MSPLISSTCPWGRFRLPKDITRLIFKEFSKLELVRFERVCKLWREAVKDNYLWERVASREDIYELEAVERNHFDSLSLKLKKWVCVNIIREPSSQKEAFRREVKKINSKLKNFYLPCIIAAIGGINTLRLLPKASFSIRQKSTIRDIKGPIMRGVDRMTKAHFLVISYFDRLKRRRYLETWYLETEYGYPGWKHTVSDCAGIHDGSALSHYQYALRFSAIERLARLVRGEPVGVPSMSFLEFLDNEELTKKREIVEVNSVLSDGGSRIVLC